MRNRISAPGSAAVTGTSIRKARAASHITSRPLLSLARELSLAGFANTLDRQSGNPIYTEMAFVERVASLFIAEKERRASSRLTRMLNEAKLPMKAAPEELINTDARGLKPAIMRELMQCAWIPDAWNILISGETGTGKSWVASFIATAAIRAGLRPDTSRCRTCSTACR